tara:strand:- start:559 stop:864 length:306 start_codon:yes stop_codon:yes gene_type:complete
VTEKLKIKKKKKKKLKPLSKKQFQAQFKGRQYHKEEAWSEPPSKTGLRYGAGKNLDTSPGGDLAGPIIKALESGKVKFMKTPSEVAIAALKYQRKKKKKKK